MTGEARWRSVQPLMIRHKSSPRCDGGWAASGRGRSPVEVGQKAHAATPAWCGRRWRETPELRSRASRRPRATSAHPAARSPKDWGDRGGGKEQGRAWLRRRCQPAGGGEWQAGSPTHADQGGWTVNQIPSTLDSLGAVGSSICG